MKASGHGILYEDDGHMKIEAFQMLIRQDKKKKTEDRLLAVVFLLETIWFHGRVRSTTRFVCVVSEYLKSPVNPNA